jgi:autotransporter-associated beta strand protein
MALRYFDRNGTTAGFGTLTGAWDTTTASWTDSAAGTATPAAFTFTDADEAQFGATGATGTAGTATIAAALNVTLNKVRTQNLAGLQTIAAGAGGKLTLAGTTPTIDVQSAGDLLISSLIDGTAGFVKLGSQWLFLTGANSTITGLVDVQSGAIYLNNTLASGTANQLPNVSFKVANSCVLYFYGNTAHTSLNDLVSGGATGNVFSRNVGGITISGDITAFNGIIGTQAGDSINALMIFSTFPSLAAEVCIGSSVTSTGGTSQVRLSHSVASAGSPLISLPSSNGFGFTASLEDNGTAASSYSGATTSSAGPLGGAAGVRTFRLTGTNTDATISGAIVQPVGSIALQKQGTGKWALSGANTYTGTTTISAGTLSAQNASALGRDSSLSGGAISVTGGTLELSGGITLDKSGLNISTVTTASPTNAFQVPASGGDNTLEVGSITLNSTIRIEVGASGALRLANTGAISGSTFGITKEGSGELDLNAAANTYTGAVAVNAGTLTVSASCAPSTAGPLGNATSAVTVTGTLKFDGVSNADVSRSVQLTGSTPALDASGTARVHFSNVSQASGSRTLTLRGTSTANNQLQSALANGSGGTLSLTKEGAGQWQVTGTPTYTGTTTVNAGTLDFGGQTLSLSGGVAMAGGTLANGNIGDTLVSAVTFTGGTVIALLDSTSTVTATSGTGRLQPLTADGSNSYTGNTTVQSGATIELVTDANPGTVGDGKVTGASNVTVTGTLATGSGVNQRGQCRYGGNLTFAAGSVLAIGAAA